MKTYLFILSLIFIACENTNQDIEPEVKELPEIQEPICYECEDSIKTITYGPDSSLTFYNVMTPHNYNVCDSFVYYNGTYIEPYNSPQYVGLLKLCTESEKEALHKQGNDTTCVCVLPTKNYEGSYYINDYFHIDGIEKFPYNKLYFTFDGDTTKIRIYYDYDNMNDRFVGLYWVYLNKQLVGPYIPYNNKESINYIQLQGTINYTLLLYKDQDRTILLDSIKGKLTVISKPQSCDTKRCYGKDKNDALLFKYPLQ